MSTWQRLDRWHQTLPGLAIFGAAELLLAYLCISWAIDSGRLLAYFLTMVFLVGGVRNGVRLARTAWHGRRR